MVAFRSGEGEVVSVAAARSNMNLIPDLACRYDSSAFNICLFRGSEGAVAALLLQLPRHASTLTAR